jgi:hypothetical protein
LSGLLLTKTTALPSVSPCTLIMSSAWASWRPSVLKLLREHRRTFTERRSVFFEFDVGVVGITAVFDDDPTGVNHAIIAKYRHSCLLCWLTSESLRRAIPPPWRFNAQPLAML